MDIADLNQRIGNLEAWVTCSGQKRSDYVRQVEEGLKIIEDRFVQQEAESKARQGTIDDLTHENMGLRTLLDKLLAVIEQESIVEVDCGLRNLSHQVETLVELTSDTPEPTTSSETPTSSTGGTVTEASDAEPLSLDAFDKQWIKEILDGLYSYSADVQYSPQPEAPIRESEAA